MKAHAALYVDRQGRLTEEPPASGLKIAAREGAEIPPHIVAEYDLIMEKGKVVQKKMEEPPPNKAVEEAPNKAAGGGLTITTSRGTISSADARRKRKPRRRS